MGEYGGGGLGALLSVLTVIKWSLMNTFLVLIFIERNLMHACLVVIFMERSLVPQSWNGVQFTTVQFLQPKTGV